MTHEYSEGKKNGFQIIQPFLLSSRVLQLPESSPCQSFLLKPQSHKYLDALLTVLKFLLTNHL